MLKFNVSCRTWISSVVQPILDRALRYLFVGIYFVKIGCFPNWRYIVITYARVAARRYAEGLQYLEAPSFLSIFKDQIEM